MRKPTPKRKAVGGAALTLVTFAIGLLLAVLVAGSASAKTSPKKSSPKAKTTQTGSLGSPAAAPIAPADKFSVINGTANAASDHEIVGSSAFPNFTTGAVDNYYTMAHAHVDNSPFAEGTSSPFDTGPIGQTAAAGNFQQPQYADARWPGGPDTASFGNQGGPDANAAADNNRANADASESSNSMSGPGLHGTKTLAVPKGFDDALRRALSAWNGKWDGRLGMSKPAPKVTTPRPTTPRAPVTVPSSPVKPPSVTTPQLPAGGAVKPAPPVTPPKLPSAGAMGATRSPAAFTVPKPPAAPPKPSPPSPGSGGAESHLSSSTLATLVYKTHGSEVDTSEKNTCKSDTVPTTGTTGTTMTTTTTVEKPKSGSCILVLTGESSVGQVSLGGGQIVIDGIHVKASITNDGTTPKYTAAITVASATIGGIPVTIDQNGVHVAGQGQGLPYQQASAALNTALKNAGIQIFLVQPEVTTCGQTGSDGSGGSSTTQSTTTTSTDQSGGTSSCGGQSSSSSCDQSGSGGGSGGGGAPGLPGQTTTDSSTTTTSSSCGQSDMGTSSCDQSGYNGSGGGTSTGTTTTNSSPGLGPSTTTTSTSQSSTTSTTSTTSSCDQSGMPPPSSSCTKAGSANGTTTGSNDQSAMTTTTDSSSPMSGGTFQFGPGPGTSNAGEETVTATGVHIVFTQPVSPSGVPAQYVEHILGEVFVDSLATPAAPLSSGGLGFSSSSLSSSPYSSSSCLGGRSGSKAGSSLTAGGSSSTGGGSSSLVSGSSAGGAGSPTGSALGASSQPSSGSTGTSLPASFAHALHKPLWLLLTYLVWQALVIGTGWSLWHWRRGGTT